MSLQWRGGACHSACWCHLEMICLACVIGDVAGSLPLPSQRGGCSRHVLGAPAHTASVTWSLIFALSEHGQLIACSGRRGRSQRGGQRRPQRPSECGERPPLKLPQQAFHRRPGHSRAELATTPLHGAQTTSPSVMGTLHAGFGCTPTHLPHSVPPARGISRGEP